MNISLETMRVGSNTMDAGDIIVVMITGEWAAWDQVANAYHMVGGVRAPRTELVHITGVPISIIDKAFILLESQRGPPQDPEDPHSGELIHERVWGITRNTLPISYIQTLNNDRELTLSWDKAKGYIRNKVTEKTLTARDLA